MCLSKERRLDLNQSKSRLVQDQQGDESANTAATQPESDSVEDSQLENGEEGLDNDNDDEEDRDGSSYHDHLDDQDDQDDQGVFKSLFQVEMPGVMTISEAVQAVDLDRIRIEAGGRTLESGV